MGNHEKYATENEWYTPNYIFVFLGCRFDMDVAAAPDGMGNVPADILCRDAFNTKWVGFVWCNPPFAGRNAKDKWVQLMSEHSNGILLMPDRSSAPWWQTAAKLCDGLLMVKGKIKFQPGPGNVSNWKQPGTGTTLFGFGEQAMGALLHAQKGGLGVCLIPSGIYKYKQLLLNHTL